MDVCNLAHEKTKEERRENTINVMHRFLRNFIPLVKKKKKKINKGYNKNLTQNTFYPPKIIMKKMVNSSL